MRLSLEHGKQSYISTCDDRATLTLVTNTHATKRTSQLIKVIRGQQFPLEKLLFLPSGNSGILHDICGNKIHTNVEAGFYYTYLAEECFYFYYQGNELVVYDSDLDFVSALWDSTPELLVLARHELRIKQEQKCAKEAIIEQLLTGLFGVLMISCSILAVFYPTIREVNRECSAPHASHTISNCKKHK